MRKFGLIGYPLGHSFSKGYFQEKFSREGLSDCGYENFEIENLDYIPEGVFGFNVTIPHKQNIIPLLKNIDDAAMEIGAVNCVDRNLKGYNTDVVGFEKSLLQMIGRERPDTLVLGTGGAAKAVFYVLKNLGINFLTVSRTGELSYDNITSEIVAEHKLIINTTPLGMYPKVGVAPALPYDSICEDHFLFDLVYNPAETQFMKEGRVRGAWVKNGLEMLRGQAEAAWEIWNRES